MEVERSRVDGQEILESRRVWDLSKFEKLPSESQFNLSLGWSGSHHSACYSVGAFISQLWPPRGTVCWICVTLIYSPLKMPPNSLKQMSEFPSLQLTELYPGLQFARARVSLDSFLHWHHSVLTGFSCLFLHRRLMGLVYLCRLGDACSPGAPLCQVSGGAYDLGSKPCEKCNEPIHS